MPKQRCIETDIKNSRLSEDSQKAHIAFYRFLNDNGFSIVPPDDVNGWHITYSNVFVGWVNYDHKETGNDVGIWLDKHDFSCDSASNALKEITWAHVRSCEHFHSNGEKCGCGQQPGYSGNLFGREFENLCFARLEFMDSDAETLEYIKELMLLVKQQKSPL